ncbi:MAG: SusD/RagB family nutrient-binding outer membrane lipoprotein [Bacteroidota bacterium]
MRTDMKFIMAAGLISILVGVSCSKKIDEAYLNPNAAVRQPVEQLFPSMIGTMIGNSNAATNSFGIAGDGINIGRYIQYWGSYIVTTTENSGTQYDRMGGTTAGVDNMGNLWGMHYFSMGYNLNRIIEWGSEEEKWDFVGAATVLRAWSMFTTTNQYGEIILKEAFNTSQQQFNYDTQEEVYDSVRAICHRGIGFLNMTGGGMNPTSFAASDFYLNKGDLNKWKKFAYGILARSYAYIHNKSTYSADSVIKYADLSVNTNAENIICTFQNTLITGTANYFGSARGNVNNASTGLRQTAFIADLMTGANPDAFATVSDPRAWYMLRENINGTIKGMARPWSGINSMPLNDEPQSFVGTYATYTTAAPWPAAPATSGVYNGELGRYIFRNDAPFPIMTASEMQFLKAEAAVRKNDPNTAKTAYVNGISLNFDMLTSLYNTNVPAAKLLDATKKADYMNNEAIVPAAASGVTLTRILLQKYIAMYGWGFQEAWADLRRYHYNKDLDAATTRPVFAGFNVPTTSELFAGPNGSGSNNGKLVQRTRPRYNSEYLYNIPALTSIGAYPTGNDYHTKECWFSQP